MCWIVLCVTSASWGLGSNILLLEPYHCQPMVIGANSTPTGIPNLECSEEENYSVQNSSSETLHGYEAALKPGSSLSKQLCSASQWSALLCSVLACSTVLQRNIFCVGSSKSSISLLLLPFP